MNELSKEDLHLLTFLVAQELGTARLNLEHPREPLNEARKKGCKERVKYLRQLLHKLRTLSTQPTLD